MQRSLVKMRKNASISVFAILLLCTNFMYFIPVESATGAPIEHQIIDFANGEGEKYVDVRPGADNSVNFQVTVDGSYFKENNISKIVCKLEAELGQRFYSGKTTSAPGWDYEIDPLTIELDPDEKKVVDVRVTVPEGTSFYSVGELTITGTATTVPGNEKHSLNELEGIIRITYYDDWKLTCSKLTRTITRGELAVFEVNLFNMGNGNDIFFQSVSNENKLVKNDIKLEYPANIELDEKSTTKFDFIVSTTDKTPKDEYVIEFCSKPTDIGEGDKTGNYLYCIQFVLTVEPDALEQYLIPSAAIFIIVLIIVFVKIVKHNDRKIRNDNRD